jgi:hypothetical protein
MEKILTHNQKWESYNEILKNRFCIDTMSKYKLGEVRKLAESIMNKQIAGYELLWRDEKLIALNKDFINSKRIDAKKEGYGENILKYLLDRDPQYYQAKEVIKLIDNIQEPEIKGNLHLLNIPTKAKPDEIMNFWLKLTGNNEKGEPYWESEKEIEHFVNQNFEGFPGVNEIKEFNPNMNKTVLNQVTWTFFDKYVLSTGKKQYVNLLIKNFTKFRDSNPKNVYSNIKDQVNDHLKKLFK